MEADRKNKNKGEQAKDDFRNLQMQYTNKFQHKPKNLYKFNKLGIFPTIS